MNNYPPILSQDVRRTLMHRLGLNPNEQKDCDEARDILSTMSADTLWDEYLRWNGIIGYSDQLKEAFLSIWRATGEGRP